MITNKLDMGKNDWSEILTGELLLFGLLGKILYTYPDENWLKPLLENETFVESPFAENQPDVIQGLKLLERWTKDYQYGMIKDAFLDLKIEYTRLFDHTSQIPVAPWESVYISKEHLLFQEQVLEVRSWYRSYGLELINLHKEPDDHIGLEMAFLAHLANMCLRALENSNKPEFEEMLNVQRRFLVEHPLRWIPTWCYFMEEYARTDFYRGITLVLRGALRELTVILDIEI